MDGRARVVAGDGLQALEDAKRRLLDRGAVGISMTVSPDATSVDKIAEEAAMGMDQMTEERKAPEPMCGGE